VRPFQISQASSGRIFSHPGHAIHTAAQIAALRGIPVSDVLKANRQNVKEIYDGFDVDGDVSKDKGLSNGSQQRPKRSSETLLETEAPAEPAKKVKTVHPPKSTEKTAEVAQKAKTVHAPKATKTTAEPAIKADTVDTPKATKKTAEPAKKIKTVYNARAKEMHAELAKKGAIVQTRKARKRRTVTKPYKFKF
jgi:hypothetical protein